jgi:hypothetical protein
MAGLIDVFAAVFGARTLPQQRVASDYEVVSDWAQRISCGQIVLRGGRRPARSQTVGANILSANTGSDTYAVVAVVTAVFSDINKNDKDGGSARFVEQPSVTDAFRPFY